MFVTFKRQLKLLSIIAICFVGLYGIETFLHGFHFSSLFGSPHPPHPLNQIYNTPVEEITLQQAKDLFDSTFNDRIGNTKIFSGSFYPGDQKLKLVKVLEKKDDLDTQFYLGRMLCISTYPGDGSGQRLLDLHDPTAQNYQHLNSAIKQLTPDIESIKISQKSTAGSSNQIMGRTEKQIKNDFLRGLKILTALAEKNYHPAQLYMGATTLEPAGVFGNIHLKHIKLPRIVQTTDGISNYCKRTQFDPKEVSNWNTINNINNDQFINTGLVASINASYQPKSNGYGLTYAKAIQYLESAGNSGLTEAWTILDRYFTRISEKCSQKRGQAYYYSQYKTAMYRKKCEQYNVCEETNAK